MASKTLGLIAIGTLLALVPLASAEWYDGKPECPPDQFCTTSAPERETDPDAPVSDGDSELHDCEPIESCWRGAEDGREPSTEEDYVRAPEGSESGITSAREESSAPKTVPAAGIALAGAGAVAVAMRRRG